MDWGMKNRLNQLMPRQMFFMPLIMDIFKGHRKLERPGQTVKRCCYADAIFVTGGLAVGLDPLQQTIVLRVSGCTSMWARIWPMRNLPPPLLKLSPERLGRGLSIFIGSEYEKRRSRIWPPWSISARITAFR